MGENPYFHETPEGFPMSEAAWASPGQMTMRFEIAHQIGYSASGLFTPTTPGGVPTPAFPQIQNAYWFSQLRQSIAPATRDALAAAASPEEWNALFLSSPDFMRR